jgi:hypothetical protein
VYCAVQPFGMPSLQVVICWSPRILRKDGALVVEQSLLMYSLVVGIERWKIFDCFLIFVEI